MTTAIATATATATAPSRSAAASASGTASASGATATRTTGVSVISVLLADGHRLFRSALTALLDREADLSVVAEAAEGDDALTGALLLRPAVAVLDLDLPGRPALDVAAAVGAQVPETRVLLLTAFARPADVKRALADGVDGVLLKDLPPERLLGAVRTLAAGGQVYESSLLVDAVRARPGGPTPRELVVLRLVADGCSVAEVARSLSLTQGTVRNHVSSVIARTGARNRVDAIRIARESGWL
jgi:two-component system response regulator DesR